MLRPAKIFENQLNIALAGTYLNPRYSHYMLQNTFHFDFRIQDNDSQWIQLASVYRDYSVAGYLECRVDRVSGTVTDVSVISFIPTDHVCGVFFAVDILRFFQQLKAWGFRKIEFSVVVGNPAEAAYDKIVSRYGGRIVGVFQDSVKIRTGEICDVKWYELFLQP